MNIKEAQEILGTSFLQWGMAEKKEFALALEPADLADQKAVQIARECKEHLSDETRKALETA
jgi:hypothetical protein